MNTQEHIERREKRIQSLIDCKSTNELAYNIWSKESEKYLGDRSCYRNPFINWIESYKSKTTPQWVSYKTPKDLAEGIWKPFLDRPDDYGLFSSLRTALVNWIECYATSD